MSGINKVAQAVGATMGTAGSNALIECIENPGHMSTNDGFTIANSIILSDPIEEMGRKVLVEAINRANKASGDGSSTTCVLTAGIIQEGMKHIGTVSPMDIKRSLEECLPTIEQNIKEQTRQLLSDGALDLDLLEQVATISSEDSFIGKRIAEIYSKIGNTGIVYWDISKTAEDTYTIGSGITVEGAGWYSPYMCDAAENGLNTNQIRLKSPHILITKQKVTSANDFAVIGAALNNEDVKDLIVFCDDIDPLVVPDLIKTRMVRGFRIAIVKMPVLFKDFWYEDLSKATGAKIIDPAAGLPMKAATTEHLGRVGNIVVTKDETFLDGIRDVSEHIKALEEDGSDESKLRVGRLNTKTARYFVGAQSDSALSYRRLKVEDAISAAWQALNGGIVPGGGSALLNASAALKQNSSIGARILAVALEVPARTIYGNAGAYVPDMFLYSGKDIGGFDSRTKTEIGDMFKAGIIDPTNIVLNAVKNAVSVAATVLTANTVVTLPRDEMPQMTMQAPVLR